MNPTTEKINVSQTDYDNLADWAKPDYSSSPNPVASAVPLREPQASISVDSLQPTGAVKIPKVQTTDTTSAGVIAGTKAIPQGWDTVTYANFKQANPDLEPDAQDTQNMLNAGNGQPSVNSALSNFNQAQGAVGTKAQDERSKLNALAASIFGEKAYAQANQVNLEKQAGLEQQQKALAEINTGIANEQVALRGEQERIRQSYATEAQKQISQNTLNDTYGRRLADLAIRQSAANANITAIQENAERQTKLLTAPLDTKISYLSTFAKDNVDYLDKKQSEKLAFLVDDLKTQKQDIQALQKTKTEAILEVVNNGGGADQAVLKAIQDAPDASSAIRAGGKYIGSLDRQAKLANIEQSRAATSKIYADMAQIKEQALANNQAIIPGNKPVGKPDNVSAGFANRATEANKIANEIEKSKGGGLMANIFTLRKAMPFVKPEAYKKYEQAEDNFISAVLRKESGASISPEERASARTQYFTQPGDTPAVVLQKQRNRVDSVNALAGAAGTAFGGTFQAKPEVYQDATFEDINPFSQTLQVTQEQIYSPTQGYVIPK